MLTVEQWTGREAVLLQSVMRLSNRDYARELGLSLGTIMKWRRQGADLVLLPRTQQILDTALRERCTPQEQAAFHARLAALDGRSAVPAPRGAATSPEAPCGFTVRSHKFLPAFVGAAAAELLWEQAEPELAGPGGLERRTLPVQHPGGQAVLHVYLAGVAVLHLEQQRLPESVTDLAVWRYRTYLEDRAWAGRLFRGLLPDDGRSPEDLAPEYVLSVYELGAHGWSDENVPTALQLLATPSVLVDRRDPANIIGLPPDTEAALFAEQWAHPDAVEFAGAVSSGLAGWSGISYYPLPTERALTTAEIVDLELDVQALWAISMHVMAQLADGTDPVMPQAGGRTVLGAAYARLTQSGPTETVQHRLMRKAVLATSELPERLAAARDALRS